MSHRRAPQSLRAEYLAYVEREVENYKESVSTAHLYAIAGEADANIGEGVQIGMREMMLNEEVGRIIALRLKLPSYETWRKRRLKALSELQRPEHWGLRRDTPLMQVVAPGGERASHAQVLVAGPRLEGSALYLAANGCDVTAVEPEQAVMNRVLRAAHDAGLTEKVRGFVPDLVSYTPDGPLAAVVCTPAAFEGLSRGERDHVIRLLQQATADGGVHLIETLVAGQAILSEDELRTRYDGWEIRLVPEPGVARTFVAKKQVA